MLALISELNLSQPIALHMSILLGRSQREWSSTISAELDIVFIQPISSRSPI